LVIVITRTSFKMQDAGLARYVEPNGYRPFTAELLANTLHRTKSQVSDFDRISQMLSGWP
jgi:hypothetical protein